jgi:hypothetical protein
MKSRQTVLWLLCCGMAIFSLSAKAQQARRTTLSLDGQWDVEDSIGPDQLPTAYHHTAPVPGLTHSAVPAFPGVDEYQGRQRFSDLKQGDGRDYSSQQRNYFWYRKTFQAPAEEAVALLTVNKAQFGTVAYLNGVRIGEHDPCFTAAWFDVTKAIRWNAPNELVIRIGAHRGVLPANVSGGTDFEKNRWTPGIYDDVSLMVMNNPVISTVQVAPQLAGPGRPVPGILVQTVLHNYSDGAVTTEVGQQVFEWKSGAPASDKAAKQVVVPAGGAITVLQEIPVPHAHLWSPEDPFLYQVKTGTAGDDLTTRFGMREFRFDTVTQRAYLNGRPYFLRGSNITLHRFFEDPKVGTLPWNEDWLHRLLVVLPRQMHWNAFRFCIGPVPDRWLQIADEAGLLIQNEYMVWIGPDESSFQGHYDTNEMITEYSEWMRDNWNHPSVAIWDASNESWLPRFTSTIIPAVRTLDLSNRPWENGYNAPAGANDPVEDHQYLFHSTAMDDPPANGGHPWFQMTDLESMVGPPSNSSTYKTAHAMILNEYDWVWLNRDGSPTLLSQKLYPRLLGDRNTTENRFALHAYLLGGLTEFWRAYRHYSAVLEFVYLTTSDPKASTSDDFIDIEKLTLEPHFQKAMEEAFNPLGVYLNFWQPSLSAGKQRYYTVAMVNDEDRPRAGKLKLAFTDAEGKDAAAVEMPFSLEPLGAQSYTLSLPSPAAAGSYTLQAIATPADDNAHPTVSHRDVTVEAAAPAH